MTDVYVVQMIDHTDRIIVGVYPSERDAELACKKLGSKLTEDQYDTGIFYRVTAFELGKTY
jgi:hypothetical protein